ncbi:TRAP transporter large permease [Devosia chinhatensis]|uniref:TRAP transporter large permease protein n=1 Tax=Devosia chinhatensis TaxID=429727 RepID=A0A0F5FLQ6_9HYPH|nr:TRAP transporter large permease subunit [Devosia chinhatensis]KKB09127.1 L-dehydroascorbate transporter large permease subunit [Devosia chinhatensis]
MSLVIFLASLGVGMAIGIPVAYALMVCAVAMMWMLGMMDPQILAQKMIDGADSYPLMAIPFFMLAGELMTAGGLSRRIVDVAMALFGHLRGGLGYVVIGTGVVLATLSGSAIADTATLAVMLLPIMLKAGYPVGRTSGLMAATGIIAPVIPPSIGFVVLGVTANLSIVKLFLAGIVPGLLMALSLVVAWFIISRRDNTPTLPRRSLRDVLKALRDAVWALLLPVIIIVGLRMGVFTPTEAGIVAAAYALFVSMVIYRELTLKGLYDCLLGSAKLTAVIMLLVAASSVTAFLITVANVPAQVIGLLGPFIDQPILLMAMMMLGVFLIGSVLDFTPAITILVPVLMPVVVAAGIDPIYFGVVFIICAAIGMITPPVGAVLNTVSGVARIPLEKAVVGIIPFLLAEIAVLVLLILFPGIVTIPLDFFY